MNPLEISTLILAEQAIFYVNKDCGLETYSIQSRGVGADELRNGEGETDEGQHDEGNGDDARPEKILAHRLGGAIGLVRFCSYLVKLCGEFRINHVLAIPKVENPINDDENEREEKRGQKIGDKKSRYEI